jgi:sucrose-6-phosphate hydrolase SacC (GH32 family)
MMSQTLCTNIISIHTILTQQKNHEKIHQLALVSTTYEVYLICKKMFRRFEREVIVIDLCQKMYKTVVFNTNLLSKGNEKRKWFLEWNSNFLNSDSKPTYGHIY